MDTYIYPEGRSTNSHQINSFFFYFLKLLIYLWFILAALGLSWGKWDPVPLHWELGVLPTGPPGKSTSGQPFAFFFSNFLSALSFSLLFSLSLSLSPILSSLSYFLLFSMSLLLSILFLFTCSLLSLLLLCPTLPVSFSLYLFLLLPLFVSPFFLLYFPPSFSPHSPLLPCPFLLYPSILFRAWV